MIGQLSDEEFIKIAAASESLSELAQKVGYSPKGGYGKNIVKERCLRLGIEIPKYNPANRKSKIYNLTDEEFTQIVKQSASLTDCCRRLNLSIYGSNGRSQIRLRCASLGLDVPNGQASSNGKYTYELKDILVANSPYTNTNRLKQRLVDNHIRPYKCQCCGNDGIWNNLPLTLQLHHINGVSNDNRLENLQLLCPNCHSQTENYAGRNIQDNDELN